MIPGASTINFDEITKERIFKSIDSANMRLLADLKKDFNLLKYKLGKMPFMMDFIEHGERDPFSFVEHSKSYFNFIRKVDKDFNPQITDKSIKLLELFSKEINNSKRVEESIILRALLTEGQFSIDNLEAYLNDTYGYKISQLTIISCLTNLNFEFIREKENGELIAVKDIYKLNVISLNNNQFVFNDEFITLLKQEQFKSYLLDSVEYAISSFNEKFDRKKWHDGFVIYRKYSRKDVFRILNVAENPVAQNVGGYLVSPDNTHCPIFVNYHKEDHISESTKYEDEFVNNKEFNWMSKSNRKLESNDVKSILGKNGEIRLPLFIKKNNDEGKEFYYMGDVSPELDKVEQTLMNNDSGTKVSVVKILFNLKVPVSDSIYNYLTESKISKIKKIEINDSSIDQQVLEEVKDCDSQKNLIPLYDFYAAAGSFSEMQSEKDFTLIEAPERYNSEGDYFACKIKGESMNKIIPNGSICLFKKYTGGSRSGKIVLVENFDYQDPDFNSAFTIKTYSSEKLINDDGWKHLSIVLRPNSYDESYKSIIINEENGPEMRIVGEFIMVL